MKGLFGLLHVKATLCNYFKDLPLINDSLMSLTAQLQKKYHMRVVWIWEDGIKHGTSSLPTKGQIKAGIDNGTILECVCVIYCL